MSWYRNAHFFQSNKVKIAFRDHVRPLLPNLAFRPPVSITYTYFYKNPASDLSNVCSVISKFFLDALVAEQLLPNDTVKEVISEHYVVGTRDVSNPRVEITIKDSNA